MGISIDTIANDFDGIEEPRRRISGITGENEGQPELPPVERKLGYILDTEDPKKVAKHVIKDLREPQDPIMNMNRAVWKQNRWWREGRRFVRLIKKENLNQWEAKLPLGATASPPGPNKTDRLCRRTVNTIWVDAAYPECEPGDSSNEAIEAAEFSTKYLSVIGSPSGLNMEQVCRSALDKAMTFGSAFAWVIADPSGAGHRPRHVYAHPLATTQQNATVDPETGMPADEESLKKRYVRPDGNLTDVADDADWQWLPGFKIRLLTGHQVQFLPETARGMEDATGMLITDITTLGDLRKLFPEEMDALNDEDLQKVCEWRPNKFKDLLPPYSREPEHQKDEDGKWKDSQTVVTVTVYYGRSKSGVIPTEYPMGCYCVVSGETVVLHKDTWSAPLPQPPDEDGNEVPDRDECLEIPLAQQRCLDDNTTDNPYGNALAEQLGPDDEITASSLGYQLENMFRFGNPHIFVPMGSIVQEKQLLLRDGSPIRTNPNGDPYVEQVPQFPATIGVDFRNEMRADQDDESGLQQAGQGVSTPDVKSGIHAQTIVQEALKAVSNIKSNSAFFYISLNRILLEQSRAFCPVPTLMSYVGKDGAYKEEEWSRTSFRSTKVVSIARGSFTMHTLIAKQEMADKAKQLGVIDNDDYMELVSGGVSPVLGVQENPHLMRIRRQIDAFKKGPPPGWLEAEQAFLGVQQQNAQLAQGNATGAAAAAAMNMPYIPAQPQAPPPRPPGPFDDKLPVDDEPMPAKIRHRQLQREQATTKFAAFPPEWRQRLIDEYMLMKNSAGVVTVPESQKLQAQQAQEQRIAAMTPKVSIGVKSSPEDVDEAEANAMKGARGETSNAGASQESAA
jgi:hypothetical protein